MKFYIAKDKRDPFRVCICKEPPKFDNRGMIRNAISELIYAPEHEELFSSLSINKYWMFELKEENENPIP